MGFFVDEFGMQPAFAGVLAQQFEIKPRGLFFVHRGAEAFGRRKTRADVPGDCRNARLQMPDIGFPPAAFAADEGGETAGLAVIAQQLIPVAILKYAFLQWIPQRAGLEMLGEPGIGTVPQPSVPPFLLP